MKRYSSSISKKRNEDLSDFKMIRRYKVHSQIGKYKAIFEMVLDDSGRNGKTLSHMRELIFKHDHQEVPATALKHFYEQFQEMAILGNSQNDLIPPDFKAYVMGDALCLKFWREEQVIERTDFLDKQVYLSNPQEWDDQLSWWREDQENELLTLAGVPLTKSKSKKRRAVPA